MKYAALIFYVGEFSRILNCTSSQFIQPFFLFLVKTLSPLSSPYSRAVPLLSFVLYLSFLISTSTISFLLTLLFLPIPHAFSFFVNAQLIGLANIEDWLGSVFRSLNSDSKGHPLCTFPIQLHTLNWALRSLSPIILLHAGLTWGLCPILNYRID